MLTEILLGVAVLLALVAMRLFGGEVNDARLAERVRAAALDTGPTSPRRSLSEVGALLLRRLALAGVVNLLASPKDRAQIERVLSPLGVPVALAAPLLVAVKIFGLIVGPLVGFAYHFLSGREGGLLLPLLGGLAAGILGPSLILSQMRKRYIDSLNRAMADTLDLLVVCAEAGLGLESAIDRVSADLRQAAPGMALEFAQLGQEMRMLPDRSVAMDRFAERAEVEGLRRLAATLAQAMRYGTPLGQALRALAGDQRNERLMRLEAKAARLPALLVLPLVVFILPPLFLILVGPSILRLMDAVGSLG
jgi:tight adherence protein C